MNKLAVIIVMILCVAVGWMLGVVSVPENPNIVVSQNVIEIKDCKEIKIDTISYNYRDSTYVLQVNIK